MNMCFLSFWIILAISDIEIEEIIKYKISLKKKKIAETVCLYFIYVKLDVNILQINSIFSVFFSPLIVMVGGVSFMFNCCIQLM